MEILIEGLVFPESPRWDPDTGSLFFSDQHDCKVLAWEEHSGKLRCITQIQNQPSGLGWSADRRELYVVSMKDRRVLAVELESGKQRLVSDLSELASYHCNDMVVDRQGTCYVGEFGFDYTKGLQGIKGAPLIRVVDGEKPMKVAEELLFPNGVVIFGNTLVVAETFGFRLTAFTIGADGALSDRRVWAQFSKEEVVPDGICLDSEGGIWVASCKFFSGAVRVIEGGEITHRVELPAGRYCYAVALGGADGRTLFLCTAESSRPEISMEKRSGQICAVRL